ncbi:MAG TPA: transcription termination/antitermination protein NusA [Sulfurimonas sp.]|nr:transcription termination/antitermination protein NusA [Sulfurimonas sp.]
MEKIVDIIESIAHEKGLEPDKVKAALKTAFIQTAKRVISDHFQYEVEFNEETKAASIFQIITVVADGSSQLEGELAEAYISLTEAKELDEDVEVEDQLQYEHQLEDYGRTAAQQLYREIEFHIQRLVEDELYDKFKGKVGTIISGRVTRVDAQQSTFVELDEIRAVLPMKSRIKGEVFKPGEILKAVVRRVTVNKQEGMIIELSRTSPKFLEELLRLEVPEINDETVVVEHSARIPGERAKIALYSTHPKVDPVGATVGVKGVRINAVSDELNGENIDCVEYTNVPELFISRAMSPAIISSVVITETAEGEDKKAKVILPGDQKSKAIGRSGINIRLASMLTGYSIELEEQEGAVTSESGEIEEEKEGIDSLEALFK